MNFLSQNLACIAIILTFGVLLINRFERIKTEDKKQSELSNDLYEHSAE